MAPHNSSSQASLRVSTSDLERSFCSSSSEQKSKNNDHFSTLFNLSMARTLFLAKGVSSLAYQEHKHGFFSVLGVKIKKVYETFFIFSLAIYACKYRHLHERFSLPKMA
jgi:hypothetical protein